MKIKEICEKTGLTDRTIRYYIEEGLISPFYTENYLGRKSFDFSQEDLENLKDIATLRAFGFSVEEIKEISSGKSDNNQILKNVRQRTGASLDESQRRLNILSAIEPSKEIDLSTLAQKLSNVPLPIENESSKRTLAKRFLSFLRASAVFLAVWLPIFSALVLLTLRLCLLEDPTIRPLFLGLTLLCLFPSVITVLIFQKRKGSGKRLRLVLSCLCVLCLPLVFFFTSQSIILCDHAYETYRVTQEATCQAEGERIVRCDRCGTFETQPLEKIPHEEETVAGVAPTCFETGLSDGIRCALCNTVLKEQITLPTVNAHTPVTDPAVPATCTASGLTKGSHCSLCNKTLVAQTKLPATGHSCKIRKIEKTCGTDGYHLYQCACGYSYRTNIVPATDQHNFVRASSGQSYHCSGCGLNVLEYGNADGSWAGGNDNVKYYVTGDRHNYRDFEIVIYGSGEMPSFSKTSLPPWESYLNQAVKITIKEGITSIGSYTFYSPDAICSCQFVMSSTVKTIKSNAIALNIRNLVLGSGVEFVEANGFGNIDSLYIPKSVKRLYLNALGGETYFYEGSLEDFYKIQLYIYNRTITIKDHLATMNDNYISNIHVYLYAQNISDRHHYWK